MKPESLRVSRHIRMIFEKASPETINNLFHHIRKLMREMKKRKGRPRLVMLYSMMDGAIRKDLERLWATDKERISCTKGCAHCCYQNVDIHQSEAVHLSHLITDDGVWFNKDELERQRSWTADEYVSQPSPCIFLRDKECTIYGDRPAVCRKHFVVTNPSDCKIAPNSTVQVASPTLMQTNLIYSAFINLERDAENPSMPAMLSAALARRGVKLETNGGQNEEI